MSDLNEGALADLRLRNRAAAFTRWSKIDNPSLATEPAREGFLRKFETQVDPEGRLAPDVRRKRAIQARTAHMLLLSRKAAAAKRANAAAKKN